MLSIMPDSLLLSIRLCAYQLLVVLTMGLGGGTTAAWGKDAVFTGRSGRVSEEFVPSSDPDRPLIATFYVTPSSMLDRRYSTLTLRLDNIPQQTVTLKDLPEEQGRLRWSVELPPMSRSVSTFTIESQLQTSEDPCDFHHMEETWARVDWSLDRPDDPDEVMTSPAELIQYRWRREPIAIDIEEKTPEAALALVSAFQFLHSHGLAFEPDPTEDSKTLSLRLSGPTDLSHSVPGRIVGTLTLTEEGLALKAPSWTEMSTALRQLEDPQTLANCESSPCFIAAPSPGPRIETDEVSPEIWRLGESMPNGWVAKGRGAHSLDTMIHLPSNISVTDPPVLLVRASADAPDRTLLEDSHLKISLGGTPIGSWKLSDLGEEVTTLTATLPLEGRDSGPTSLTFQTLLSTDPDQTKERCAAEAASYFSLSPDTVILGAHERYRFDGLSQTLKTQEGPLRVTWTDSPSIDALQLLSRVTEDLITDEGLRYIPPPCEGCLELLPASSSKASPLVLDVEGTRFWDPQDPTSPLPLQPLSTHPVLLLTGDIEDQTRGLLLLYDDTAPIPIPETFSAANMPGKAALWTGTNWRSLRRSEQPMSVQFVPLPQKLRGSGVPSVEQRFSVNLNRWLSFAIVLFGLAGVWQLIRTYRNRRLSYDLDGTEVEE